MSDKWAYTAHGRLRNHDQWDWAGPNPKRDPLVKKLYQYGVAQDLHNDHGEVIDQGINVIGFDGKNWFAGRVGKPSAVLDAAKYDPALYSSDGSRPTVFHHGYTSESATFPEKIPHVDAAHFKAMHEQHILPLYEESVAHPHKAIFSDDRRKMTSFDASHPQVPLTEHLPEEAIAKLRAAHSAGKPIALYYDPTTKEYFPAEAFASGMSKEMEPLKQSSMETQHSVPATVEKNIEKAGKGWVSRFKEMHPVGKTAIIGGAVALGAALGYWAFKSKNDKSKESQEGAAIR